MSARPHKPFVTVVRANLLALMFGTAFCPAIAQPAPSSDARDSTRAALVRDIAYLASELLEGRATGSAGGDSAANFLAKAYLAMQVAPVLTSGDCDTAGACRLTYFQVFRPPVTALTAAGIRADALAFNVIAGMLGTDSTLRGQWLVVGGHYDHLGRTGLGARDLSMKRAPHLGADDNASGTAAVLELARRLSSSPMRRPVMFVNFGAEELGLVGSTLFVQIPPVPVDSISAMFNFDMVGHLGGGRLLLRGLASSADWRFILDTATAGLRLPIEPDFYDDPSQAGSDHAPFSAVGVPVVHFFTGLHDAYHTRFDTVAGIDVDGMMKVIDFAERVIRLVGDGNRTPARSKR